MQKCWKTEPAQRPSFGDLADIFDRLLQERTVTILAIFFHSLGTFIDVLKLNYVIIVISSEI